MSSNEAKATSDKRGPGDLIPMSTFVQQINQRRQQLHPSHFSSLSHSSSSSGRKRPLEQQQQSRHGLTEESSLTGSLNSFIVPPTFTLSLPALPLSSISSLNPIHESISGLNGS